MLTETGPASEVQGPSEPATGGPGPGTPQMGTKTRAFPVPQTRNPGPPETLLCHAFWGLLKKKHGLREFIGIVLWVQGELTQVSCEDGEATA